MSDLSISHPAGNGKITDADILAALEQVFGLPFVTYLQHFGGHGTHTLARPDTDEDTGIPTVLIVWNGQGRCLGQWGRDFGRPDPEATARLFDDRRAAACQRGGPR